MIAIDLKEKFHINFFSGYVGPDRKFTYLKYIIQYRLINHKIIIHNKHQNQLLDFVINKNHNIVLGKYHLYLSNDADYVYGAGRIRIDEYGIINYLDNWSGHYQPTLSDFHQTKLFIYNKFIIDNDCVIHYIDK
jgi:hypothetical protein